MFSSTLIDLYESHLPELINNSNDDLPEFCFVLGLMYLYGKYRRKNPELGIQYLFKSVRYDNAGGTKLAIGSSESVTNLGLLFKNGYTSGDGFVFKKNSKLAIILLGDRALEGEAVAILHLRLMQKEMGELTVSEEDFKAVGKIVRTGYYPTSIKDRNKIQFELSNILKKNEKSAFEELLKEIEKGYAYDIFNLALAYEHGIGTKVNKRKACELYLRAHQKGHELGKQYADKLIEENKKATAVKAASSATSTPQPTIVTPVKPLLPQEPKHIPPSEKPDPKKVEDDADKKKRLLNGVKDDITPLRNVPKKQKTSELLPNVQTVSVKLKDFHPEVDPKQLDYALVGFFKKKLKPVLSHKSMSTSMKDQKETSSVLQSETSTLSDNAINQIGQWGEGCVYFKLKEYYQEKYPSYQLIEQKAGFILKSHKNSIEIIWHNKEKESYKSKDFTVIKTKEGTKSKHHIEVKSTTSNSEHVATFSKNEFLKMLKYHKGQDKRYSIFRVYNAGNKQKARIEKIKDPLDKIMHSELKVNSLLLSI